MSRFVVHGSEEHKKRNELASGKDAFKKAASSLIKRQMEEHGGALKSKVAKKMAKKEIYKIGVKNVGKEKTIAGLKKAFYKHRPESELRKEAGIGEYKERYGK